MLLFVFLIVISQFACVIIEYVRFDYYYYNYYYIWAPFHFHALSLSVLQPKYHRFSHSSMHGQKGWRERVLFGIVWNINITIRDMTITITFIVWKVKRMHSIEITITQNIFKTPHITHEAESVRVRKTH